MSSSVTRSVLLAHGQGLCLHRLEYGGFLPALPTPSLSPVCLSAGVGGNLVAVQASRISTFLHMNGMPGENSEPTPRRCPSPCTTFFSPGKHSISASRVRPCLEEEGLQTGPSLESHLGPLVQGPPLLGCACYSEESGPEETLSSPETLWRHNCVLA